jgi:hypothetical protein
MGQASHSTITECVTTREAKLVKAVCKVVVAIPAKLFSIVGGRFYIQQNIGL